MNEELKRAEFIVNGFVQGVGFRFFVYRKARELNLTGFAANLYDGSVRVVAEGRKCDLELLYELLKSGPSRSDVESVLIDFSDYKHEFDDFAIK